jgi:hypothetical protein
VITNGFPTSAQVRHRCRNIRCGAKLREPTENPHRAFCCAGCAVTFHRNRCVVCEAKLPPGPANRRVCHRVECRAEWRKFPQTYHSAKSVERPPRSADSTGLKIDTKADRPFRIVAAGTPISATTFWLASLPPDPELVTRLNRANALPPWRRR